ncbi:hypothetical protein [Aquimarina latercula]|uniref:hypothetical protein n=1 Tax=Aquimarina latercula TaxID=987 RepID=UPI000403B818|nr:hypothetical protein [Aquimarina latercula]
MAKIKSVELKSIPETINVGDNVNDITVLTTIEFHPLDIKLEMEYCLHIFVYDILGEVDAPMILPNWDESKVVSISLDRKDIFLGEETCILTAEQKETTITTPMALTLGKLDNGSSYHTRKLEVFATVAPAIGRASKWSAPFKTQIIH